MKRIIILGAGIIGVTSAYYLAKKGYNVKVLDAASGPGLMTSFANGSQLSYSKTHPLSDIEILKRLPRLVFDKNTPIHIHPRFDLDFFRWGSLFLRECMPKRSEKNAAAVLDIALRSRTALHALIQEHDINFDYARRGKLYVFTEENEFHHVAKDIDKYREHGITQRILDANSVVELEPALADMKSLIKGAIFSDIDESGDAKKFTEEMARICAAMGVEFEYGTKVSGFRTENRKVTTVVAGDKEYTADDIVICLGAETPLLMKQLGIYVPIYPMKGYSITVKATQMAPEINITDEEKRVVYSKIGDRLRIAGVAEFAGWDYKINRGIMDNMIEVAKTRFPRAGDYSEITEWTGLRPMTPSTVPIIGQNNKYSNLYFNTGHGMLGWTLACGSAEKLAETILN